MFGSREDTFPDDCGTLLTFVDYKGMLLSYKAQEEAEYVDLQETTRAELASLLNAFAVEEVVSSFQLFKNPSQVSLGINSVSKGTEGVYCVSSEETEGFVACVLLFVSFSLFSFLSVHFPLFLFLSS